MKLIVGLGNPEQRYEGTRHNVGFFVLDGFAAKHSLTWQHKSKFKADIAEGDGFILVKPTTYYNLIGESVRAIADFYKLEVSDIGVVHDDLALPLGTIRTRIGGSAAGNNGIKSLNAHIGEQTARIRIGTYTPHRDTVDDAVYVLSKLTRDEQGILNDQTPVIYTTMTRFLEDSFESSTHKT